MPAWVAAPSLSGSDALSLQGVSKRFRTSWGKPVIALRDASFAVGAGEIFGLLGPNGAGKSTTLKILLGFMRPSGGSGSLLGRPLGSVEARSRVGFLPENPYFYDYLTAREFLDACASLSGLPRDGRRAHIDRTLDRVGLDPGLKLRLRKYSKGMLQRVGLAQAILHEPALLILDEPMSGLDPIGRRQVRDLILELKREGKTIIFSSHVLPDAEALCERVGILVQGTLRQVGKVADLLRHRDSGFEIEVGDLPDGLWQRWSAAGTARRSGDRILLTAPDRDTLDRRLSQMLTSGAAILGVRPVQRSLEDVFLDQVNAGTPRPEPLHRSEEAA